MEPHFITAQNRLTATIEAAVDKAVRRVLDLRAQTATEPGGKDWLTNREAQAYLGLSKPTLARYRASGKLPYSRLGSSVYYRLDDLNALLESGAVRVAGQSGGGQGGER